MRPLSINIRLFTIFLISSILVFSLDSLGFLSLVKSSVQYVFSPIQYGLYQSGMSVKQQWDFVAQARFAGQQNIALNQQLGDLLVENARLRKDLNEKNAQITQQSALNALSYQLVAARPLSLDRYLLIDRGSQDGLKINQAVIFKDTYIGMIVEVSDRRASVRLASDPDSKISAFASNQEGKAKGLLVGQYGAELLLDKVLHSEPLGNNDIVYSDGVEGRLPRGLILGKVSEVLLKDNEVFKQAKVSPIFTLSDLDVVYVINE